MRQPGKLLALVLALTSLTALAGGSSGSLSTYGLPNPTSQPNDITVAPDGNVWFTESADGARRIGRLDTTLWVTHMDEGKISKFTLAQ
jgi:virginiamycin B lyase